MQYISEENKVESVEEFFSDHIKTVTYLFIEELDRETWYKINNSKDYKPMAFKKNDKYYFWLPVNAKPEEFLSDLSRGIKAHEKNFLTIDDETIYFELKVDLANDIKMDRVYMHTEKFDIENHAITFQENVIKRVLEHV